MINASEIVATWKKDGKWSISPGCNFSAKGNYVSLGDDVSLGDGCKNAVDIGFADGYRKCLAEVNGVAYIGAGCRWFTLADALKHWGEKEDRKLTMCLMQSAIAIADLNGWKHN